MGPGTDQTARFRELRWWNVTMFLLHLVQAIVILVLADDFSVTLTTSFLQADTDSLDTVIESVATVPLAPMIAAFLLISALAHFIMAFVAYGWYVRQLKNHINYIRWYEYSFSASLMVVIIAILSGVFDIPSLILLFSLTAAMIIFGLVMEIHNQTTKRTNWTSFVAGSVFGFIPWAIIAWYFFAAITSGDAIPTFVYFILPTLFILFFTFALNMVLQYKKVGPWRDYLYGERGYMILSLVAKSALAWQVFAGTLARDM